MPAPDPAQTSEESAPASPPPTDSINLEPASASKVLQADLRNSVAAVANGQRIPKADRDRLETSLLTDASPETIAKLTKERQANLLKIWASGRRRLTPAELKEIEHLLPKAPSSQAAPATAAPIPPADQSFTLEPTPAAAFSNRSGCVHSLVPGCPYETTYSTKIRTIKRWRSSGAHHTPPAYPPLDEPHRMAGWWRLVMKHKVPDNLLALEEAAPPPAVAPAPAPAEAPSAPASPCAAPASLTPSAPSPTPPASAPPPALETGFEATLNRLSRAESVASQRYTDAMLSPDEATRATATALKREWLDLADTVRTYQRDRAKILRESGETWDRAAVVEALTSVHNILAPGVRRLWRTIRRRHPDFTELPPTRQEEIFGRETDALFAVLLNTAFTSASLPEPAPTPDPEPPSTPPEPAPPTVFEPPAPPAAPAAPTPEPLAA